MKQGARCAAALAAAFIGIGGIGLCGAGCGGEEASAEDGLTGVTLATGELTAAGPVDSFDDGDVSDWADLRDAASTVTHRLSSSRAQNGSTSMKIIYTVSAAGYGGVEKLFATRPDWSGAKSLTLWVYGLGTGHPFTVQLYDAGGERWEITFKVDFTGWRLETLPFANFVRSSFQPPSAVANGARDLVGVRGLALVVAHAGQVGSVYVDALATSTSTTASTTTAAPPPPPASGPAGTIVPLYIYPSAGKWDALLNAHAAHPTVPIVAVVNPGLTTTTAAADANYTNGIARLLAAGIKVAGYVPTGYGTRPAADAKVNVDRWKALYPSVNAIFFDEMGNKAGMEAYYKDLSTHAKGRGATMTIGNAGTDVSTTFLGTVDTIIIYEGAGVPSADRVGGWHASYDRRNFAIIPYACPSSSLSFVPVAKPTVGWIYLQSDVMPNPWDTLPSYFDGLLTALQ